MNGSIIKQTISKLILGDKFIILVKMSEYITKDDLRQFALVMMNDFRKIIEESKNEQNNKLALEWLKSRVVRKLLDISAGSLQNLRITGKIRFKKVLGSYYYSRADIMNLFRDK
jgi:hypothetical protein